MSNIINFFLHLDIREFEDEKLLDNRSGNNCK